MSEIIEDEVWKDVVGYEGLYMISDKGRVLSCKKSIIRNNGRPTNFPEKIMKPMINHKGYEIIDLRKKGSRKCGFVHRLVAKAFLDNNGNKPQVNHKNGIKTDNNLNNLEWVTNQENMTHAFENGLTNNSAASKSRERRVVQLDKKGNFLKEFNSINDAIIETEINNISAVCRGTRKFAGGFRWTYSTEFGGDSNVSR